MKLKKHLSFTALRTMISARVRSWLDPRREKSTHHSLHDAVMSGLACLYFQEPSLLQFQTEMESTYHSMIKFLMLDKMGLNMRRVAESMTSAQDSAFAKSITTPTMASYPGSL